jgi:hypothetical protein
MPWSNSNRKLAMTQYLPTGITGKNGPNGHYLRATCGQNLNQVSSGLVRVGSAQNLPIRLRYLCNSLLHEIAGRRSQD